MKELKKEIKKNYIGCTWFYKQNQKFYSGAIVLYLLQAMAFNAIMDVPSLIFILIMVAGYVVRKEITIIFRTYSFFMTYWLNFIVFIKFAHDVIVKIPFIEEHLKT